MPKKPKSIKCSTGWCKNHLFEMLPLKNSYVYYRKKMKMRLCPKHHTSTNRFTNTMPVVNHDQKHYTPCFILEEEKNYYQDNDQKLHKTHKLKLQSQGQATILVPKHGRKKNYCSVCKTDYDDYLEHVDELNHRTNLRNNRFSRYILEVEKEMQQQHIREIEASLFSPLDIITKMVDQTKDIDKNKIKNEEE